MKHTIESVKKKILELDATLPKQYLPVTTEIYCEVQELEKELREQITHLEKQDQDHMVPLGFITIRLKEILGNV